MNDNNAQGTEGGVRQFKPSLPALSLAGGILGLFGAGSALFNMPQAAQREILGVAGASLLLLLFSAYDVYAALRSSVTVDDEGVSIGKKKFAYKDIYGLIPPTARGAGLGITDADGRTHWAAHAPKGAYMELFGALGFSGMLAKAFEKQEKLVFKTRFQYGYSIFRQTAVMALASVFLWLIKPWMGGVCLVAALVLGYMTARQILNVPIDVAITPQAIAFRYSRMISVYEWRNAVKIYLPNEDDDGAYVRFDDDRTLRIPPERPFYNLLTAYLEETYPQLTTKE